MYDLSAVLTFALVGALRCRPLPLDVPVIWQACLAVGSVRVVLQQFNSVNQLFWFPMTRLKEETEETQ